MARRTARHDLGAAVIPGQRGERHPGIGSKRPRGPRPLGPYPSSDSVRLPDVAVGTVLALVPWLDDVGAAEIAGTLQPFNGRARTILLALLEGRSALAAAARAGVSTAAVDGWRRDPEFSDAFDLCYSMGSAHFEDELVQRALAGPDDRGSMRALELVVKARNPEYRDKAQVQMGVVHVMGGILRDAAGWRVNEASTGSLPSGE